MERLRKFPKITQVVSGRAYVLKHLSPSMFSVLDTMLCPLVSLEMNLTQILLSEGSSSGRRVKTNNRDMQLRKLRKQTNRGSCHRSRSKGKGEKLYLSRDKIYFLRGTDAQKFLLTAPYFLPTVYIVFLKVAPGQNFLVIVFDPGNQLPPVFFFPST